MPLSPDPLPSLVSQKKKTISLTTGTRAHLAQQLHFDFRVWPAIAIERTVKLSAEEHYMLTFDIKVI